MEECAQFIREEHEKEVQDKIRALEKEEEEKKREVKKPSRLVPNQNSKDEEANLEDRPKNRRALPSSIETKQKKSTGAATRKRQRKEEYTVLVSDFNKPNNKGKRSKKTDDIEDNANATVNLSELESNAR